jgi:hypothetical protein
MTSDRPWDVLSAKYSKSEEITELTARIAELEAKLAIVECERRHLIEAYPDTFVVFRDGQDRHYVTRAGTKADGTWYETHEAAVRAAVGLYSGERREGE